MISLTLTLRHQNHEDPCTLVKVIVKKNEWHLFIWTRQLVPHEHSTASTVLNSRIQSDQKQTGEVDWDSSGKKQRQQPSTSKSGIEVWPKALTWTWVESRSRSRYHAPPIGLHVARMFILVFYVIEPVSGRRLILTGPPRLHELAQQTSPDGILCRLRIFDMAAIVKILTLTIMIKCHDAVIYVSLNGMLELWVKVTQIEFPTFSHI